MPFSSASQPARHTSSGVAMSGSPMPMLMTLSIVAALSNMARMAPCRSVLALALIQFIGLAPSQRCTRPVPSPLASFSTSETLTRLKSPMTLCLRQEAATANSSACWRSV